jgi:hypothetical protein
VCVCVCVCVLEKECVYLICISWGGKKSYAHLCGEAGLEASGTLERAPFLKFRQTRLEVQLLCCPLIKQLRIQMEGPSIAPGLWWMLFVCGMLPLS